MSFENKSIEQKAAKKVPMAFRFLILLIMPAMLLMLVSPSAIFAYTYNAASCSSADIQAAINAAVTGDTINVPAGTCTWTATVTIPETKTINLIGAGSSNTIISRNCARMLVSQSPNSRVSGFRFNMIGSCSSDTYSVEMKNVGWRLDHNYFDNQTHTNKTAVSANGVNLDVMPEGLIDSNTFNECRVSSDGAGNFTKANTAWTMDTLFGMNAGVHNVYIENNTITVTTDDITLDISGNAGSYVFRYNDVNGGPVMAHSSQGSRGSKSWEVYNNKFTFITHDFSYIGFMRGGTGMFYNNLVTGPYSGSYVITLDNVRSIPGQCPYCDSNKPPGYCDATSLDGWDGDTPGQHGWPCRDQIGRGKDASISSFTNMQAQVSEPAYFWNNKRSTGANVVPAVAGSGYNSTHIQAGRDYFTSTTYDGLAQKPTGYAAYTCPHPLVGSGSCDPSTAGTAGYVVGNLPSPSPSPTQPAAPSGLSAAGVSSSQINLCWTDNSNNEDGFKIERCTDAGCTNSSLIATLAANVKAYSVTGLTADTTYYYRVRAYNSAGNSGYSNTASARTLSAASLPAAPSNLTALTVSSSQIKLSWTDNSNNETGFKIERCKNFFCTDFTQIASVAANARTYTSTGLNRDTIYTYRVRSYNSAGNSDYSNTAARRTLP